MKIEKLFEKFERLFEKDSDSVNENKKVELMKDLEKKIASIKDKIKKTSSKSKTLKLKKKLGILSDLKTKMES